MALNYDIMPPKDFDFDEFLDLTETHLTDYGLNNEWLANQLGVSDRQLYYKVKEILGTSPRQYINHRRMEKAYEYLDSGEFETVKAVANAVGYAKVSYFSTLFERIYGIRPIELINK